jgi:tRNA-2-methylthio-N6-dimethylallyladenosine synthase
MRRGYTREEYLGRIERLRERCPAMSLSTDIIVGFPGETEGEFEATLELLTRVKYDEIFSFMYSPRPQTVSAKLYDDDILDQVKKDRLKAVQSLQNGISLVKNRQRIGSVEEILVEGNSRLKNGQIMGRTRSNRIVNVKGPESLIGCFQTVRIIGATANSLIGEILNTAAQADIYAEGETA